MHPVVYHYVTLHSREHNNLKIKETNITVLPTSADRGCRVVSATNPHGR
jgi:hypothetical protein